MRRWIGGHAHVAKVVLVAAMALLVASCQWVNGLRADHSIELAHRLFQTGHFLQAAEQYEDVLAKDPTRVEAHHFLAISYDRQYDRAFALDDDKERLLRLAIGALRRWVALEPENPEALYTIATFYRKEAMEDSRLTAEEEHAYLVPALAEVERALTVDDDYVEALRYKDTLLRMRAQLTVDAGAAAQMVVEADLARDRAAALQ